MRRLDFVGLFALASIFSFSQTEVTIDFLTEGRYFSDSSQTLSGELDPLDATLQINGVIVTVESDGSFSYSVTLTPGQNTFNFLATKAGYLDGTLSVDLFSDQTPPVIQVEYPDAGFHTNQSGITILGSVTDDWDPEPIVTRDGQQVPTTNGAFEYPVVLDPGENTFLFETEDAAGNTSDISITVFQNNVGPVIDLQTPAMVEHGAAFDISLSTNVPDDIVLTALYWNNDLVYSETNGSPVQQSFTQTSAATVETFRAVVQDVYGNTAETENNVLVIHPYYVFGQVLDDATSHPLSGANVSLTTPSGTYQATADLSGTFGLYLLPVHLSPLR